VSILQKAYSAWRFFAGKPEEREPMEPSFEQQVLLEAHKLLIEKLVNSIPGSYITDKWNCPHKLSVQRYVLHSKDARELLDIHLHYGEFTFTSPHQVTGQTVRIGVGHPDVFNVPIKIAQLIDNYYKVLDSGNKLQIKRAHHRAKQVMSNLRKAYHEIS